MLEIVLSQVCIASLNSWIYSPTYQCMAAILLFAEPAVAVSCSESVVKQKPTWDPTSNDWTMSYLLLDLPFGRCSMSENHEQPLGHLNLAGNTRRQSKMACCKQCGNSEADDASQAGLEFASCSVRSDAPKQRVMLGIYYMADSRTKWH